MLPMQMVALTPGGETIAFRFGFLAPTTANLGEVTPTVPPGFAKEAGSPRSPADAHVTQRCTPGQP